MDIALDRGHQDAPGTLARGLSFALDVRFEDGHSLLHRARRLDYLRQEHLARTKTLAHEIHAVHERPFDNVDGARIFA